MCCIKSYSSVAKIKIPTLVYLLGYKWFVYKWHHVVNLILLYWRIVLMCRCLLYCIFCVKWMREYFSLSNQLILIVVILLIFGGWKVQVRKFVFVSLDGAKFRILYCKQFLDKKFGGIYGLMMILFCRTLWLYVQCWIYILLLLK